MCLVLGLLLNLPTKVLGPGATNAPERVTDALKATAPAGRSSPLLPLLSASGAPGALKARTAVLAAKSLEEAKVVVLPDAGADVNIGHWVAYISLGVTESPVSRLESLQLISVDGPHACTITVVSWPICVFLVTV